MKTKYENLENEQLLSEYNDLYNKFTAVNNSFEKLQDTLDALEIIESVDRKDIDNVELGACWLEQYRSEVFHEIEVVENEMLKRYFEAFTEDESILWEPALDMRFGHVLYWFDENYKNVTYRVGTELK